MGKMIVQESSERHTCPPGTLHDHLTSGHAVPDQGQDNFDRLQGLTETSYTSLTDQQLGVQHQSAARRGRGKDKKERERIQISMIPGVPIKYSMLCWMQTFCEFYGKSEVHVRDIPDYFKNKGSHLQRLKNKDFFITDVHTDGTKGWYSLTDKGRLKASEILTVNNPFSFQK